ncbi:MAG: amidase domain-containing protein [Clostridia bacterium]|jgi:hypothetical protein|nr:amidase domain-containing protein [Clostridia bacterium]
MKEISYNRQKVVEYAQKWAYARNPQYYNFDSVGGDCTSFASQCIYAGANVMNYLKQKGWYYINGNNKSPAWSGVEFLYNFLTTNKSEGPYGKEVNQNQIEIGDIAQLSFNGKSFGHTLVITKIQNRIDLNEILISSHTYDSFNKRISEYNFEKIRFIHIDKVRK